MRLAQKINAFIQLGLALNQLDEDLFTAISLEAAQKNPWFTPENTRSAIQSIALSLQKEKIKLWTSAYPSLVSDKPMDAKKVGVIMAGNIPAVGFQDFMAVLMSGHCLYAKLSTQDAVILKFIAGLLIDIEPAFDSKIVLTEKMNDVEAIIATGSDNSSRYFEYYFSKIPHIIRKNRNAVAILNGNEDASDFQNIGRDIFQYFGLGCRSISKMYVPDSYNFSKFFESVESFKEIIYHAKYANNYEYQRSILLLNQIEHWDNGFLLLQEKEPIASPIGVAYYESYHNQEDLELKLKPFQNQIQCITSKNSFFPNSIPFGETQSPQLWDYADGVDTMEFLLSLR